MALKLKKSDFSNYPKDYIREKDGRPCIINPKTDRCVLLDGEKGKAVLEAYNKFFPKQESPKTKHIHFDNNILKLIADKASPKTQINMKRADKNMNTLIPSPENVERTNHKFFLEGLKRLSKTIQFSTMEEFKAFETKYWRNHSNSKIFSFLYVLDVDVIGWSYFNDLRLQFQPQQLQITIDDVYNKAKRDKPYKIEIYVEDIPKFDLYKHIENDASLSSPAKRKVLKVLKRIFSSDQRVYFNLDKDFQKEWNDYRKAG